MAYAWYVKEPESVSARTELVGPVFDEADAGEELFMFDMMCATGSQFGLEYDIIKLTLDVIYTADETIMII